MTTKKSSTKKAVTKKRSTLPRVKARSTNTQSESFRLVKSDTPFMTFRVNKETLYWLVLGVVVIMFTVWILQLQSDIQSLYDNIEIQQRVNAEMSEANK